MYAKGKGSTVPSDAQAREKLALYVYEYLLHVGAQKSAQTFLSEIRWEKNITLGEPPGFLHSWWCVFWDLYCAAPERRETCDHSSEAKAFHDYGFVNSGYTVNGMAPAKMLVTIECWCPSSPIGGNDRLSGSQYNFQDALLTAEITQLSYPVLNVLQSPVCTLSRSCTLPLDTSYLVLNVLQSPVCALSRSCTLPLDTSYLVLNVLQSPVCTLSRSCTLPLDTSYLVLNVLQSPFNILTDPPSDVIVELAYIYTRCLNKPVGTINSADLSPRDLCDSGSPAGAVYPHLQIYILWEADTQPGEVVLVAETYLYITLSQAGWCWWQRLNLCNAETGRVVLVAETNIYVTLRQAGWCWWQRLISM
ncbi:hypothetical protein RRG08_043405 [Elysia crispata]|uniref:LisH domain-containing protein n=1 Tax=Elysia crispata TaxID=231223 RepID=A0AAE1E4I7_9GAST|nr:hypothetical protein RRG08_043405 [Elysia crispata]